MATRLRACDTELGMVLVCGSLLLGAARNRRLRRLGGRQAALRVPAVSIRLAPWLVSLSLAVAWITLGSHAL